MRSTHWFDDLLMIKFEEGEGEGEFAYGRYDRGRAQSPCRGKVKSLPIKPAADQNISISARREANSAGGGKQCAITSNYYITTRTNRV